MATKRRKRATSSTTKKRATKKRATKKRTTRRVLAKKRPAKKRARRAPAPRLPFRVGSDVKLIFEPDQPIPGMPAGERMWVRVTRIHGRRASGWLNDKPYFMRGIRERSRVSFDASQVVETINYG